MWTGPFEAWTRWCSVCVLWAVGAATLTAQPAEVMVSSPDVTMGTSWVLDTDPSQSTVQLTVGFLVNRDQPMGEPRDIPFRIDVRMVQDSEDPVLAGFVVETFAVHVSPVVVDMQLVFPLSITPDIVLSEHHGYVLHVAVFHDDDPPSGDFQFDHLIEDGPHDIAHFSGLLRFGSVETTVNALSVPPEFLGAPGDWRLVLAEGELANGTPFLNGPPPSTPHLDVQRDDSDGSVSVVDGSVLLDPPDSGFSVNGWSGQLGRVTLDANGLVAHSFRLDLPEGTGWRSADNNDPAIPRTLNPTFLSEGGVLPVDEDLQPIAGASGTFFQSHEFVDERQAIGFVSDEWSWDLETLRIGQPETRFFRQWYHDQWKSVKGDLPDTNDGYFDQLLADALTDLHIRPGMAGGFSVELGLAAGEFFTHFPHGYVRHQGGMIRLENSMPDPTVSGLNGATTAIVTHTGCRSEEDPHALPNPATMEAVAVGPGAVRFTAHGSLWTEGAPLTSLQGATVPIVRRAAAGLDPDTGLPVHETDDYIGQPVQILIPGALAPAAPGVPGALNPARWLYTGLRPDDDDALEPPGTSAYLAGAADYAGVNFRHFPGLNGVSRIGGGVMGPYALESCQKVYARSSGVTGRWVADASSLPPSMQIGGPDPFTMEFNVWAFQLVGNEPQFEYSAVTGSVSLPYPADMTLAFDSIEFSCCGNLDRVSLADGQSVQELAYWANSRIAIQSARFVSADDCSMEDSALELHVRARVNGFPNDLDGILLFRGSGRMTTGLDDPLPASALYVPTGSPFAGDYILTSVRHAYYNDPGPVDPNQSGPGEGFISVAGHLQLPFFEAMEVHAVLNGTDPPPAGNPDTIPGMRRGWTDNGDTFFNNANFDAAHLGLPPGFATGFAYVTGLDEAHLTIARRTWFGKIPFNFPVLYDPFTRHFHSVEKKEIDIIIAQAEADVPRLNHRQAAIDFGITVGLSLNNLFSDVLEFATGHLVEGFADLVIGSALEGLGEGLDALDGLLSLQARDALGEAVVPGFDEIIATAAQQIRNGADVQAALGHINFGAGLQEDLAAATAGFVSGKLEPISGGLSGVRNFLSPDETTQVGQFMQAAMGFLDLPPGLGSLSVDDLIALAELTDGPVRDRLEELRERMEELRELVENVSGLGDQLENLLTGANAEFMGLQTGVRNALEGYFETVHADPSAYTQAEIEARIRNEIEDRLWALPVTGQVQNVLRSRFYHFDHLITQVVSNALEMINRAIADIIAEAVDLDELLNDLTGFTGYVQAFSLKGEAIITGNDLTYLSLKGRTTIQTEPVPLDFHPFYEYQQLHSDGASGCDPNAQPVQFNRITMGATVAPARMPIGEVSVTVSTQFSFMEDGRIIGFMGGFEFLQEGLSMQPVNFDRINALINIGGDGGSEQPFASFEFYFAAEGHATVFANSGPVQIPWSNFKLHGGIFLGKTCTDAPYAAWAPGHVVNNLPGSAFTGAIAAVDGKFPFIDAGCLLRVKAGAGIGAWGVADMQGKVSLGAFVEGSVSGRFACIISGDGSVLLIGLADENGASMSGSIEANITAGACPLCLEFESKIGVTLGTPGGLSVNL